MVKAEDEVHFDIRSSCTNHEAVIKIMGGMQGSIRKPLVNLNDPFVQLEQVVRLNGSLETFFNELRETARLELLDALDAGVETSAFLDKEYAVKRIDALFEDFMDYLMAIDDEVAKGNGAALRIDQFTTEKSGTVHISLNSLRRWAQAKFEISIEGIEYGVQSLADTSNESSPQFGSDTEQNTPVANAEPRPRNKMLDQEKAILNAINELGVDPAAFPPKAPGVSGVKSVVRGKLINSPLFKMKTSFKNTWERLRGSKIIVDAVTILPINK